jgi:hypothetical protein
MVKEAMQWPWQPSILDIPTAMLSTLGSQEVWAKRGSKAQGTPLRFMAENAATPTR